MSLYSKDFMAGWLSGFFDGEGSASFKTHCSGKKHASYFLSVSNTDQALMTRCAAFLDALGIEHTEWSYRPRTPNRKPFATLHICKGQSVRAFAQLVGFGAPLKQGTLRRICDWSLRDRKRPSVFDGKLAMIAARHYEGLSIRAVLRELGIKPGAHSAVCKRLRESGYTVRQTKGGRPPPDA